MILREGGGGVTPLHLSIGTHVGVQPCSLHVLDPRRCVVKFVRGGEG